MRRLLPLLFAFLTLVSAHAAEQWRSDRFRCSLTYPEGESWVQGTPLPLPAGEMIYTANHGPSKQTVSVVVVPQIPNNDLENAAVISRIMEPIVALGFQVISHAPVTVNNEKFLQLAARRSESAASSIICVARAALRENTLYIVMAYGRGDEELTTDKYFLRVLNTFTLLGAAQPTERIATGLLAERYRTAYLTCFAAVASLLLIGIGVVFFSRETAQGQH